MIEPKDEFSTLLLDNAEFQKRIDGVRSVMASATDAPDALLLADNSNIYDLTGRVFAGWIYVPFEGDVVFFVKRPVVLKGDSTEFVRKPEEIASRLARQPRRIGLELDTRSFSEIRRLKAIFPEAELCNASAVMREARSRKTAAQIDMIRRSGVAHQRVYSRIPHIFTEGMSDIELQIEIERVSRLEGSLGQFRISGDSMEFFMGNVLVGENADNPSPYDFAMGGAGSDPSLPVGANGTMIRPGTTVMVDMGGDFTGYMTDMTRVFALGEISEVALRAHQCSIDIHAEFRRIARPGVTAREIYEMADNMVHERGLHEYFMGHRQKAGFIGHGVGIEINELPVIAPRSRDILAEGNVIALEPKFVIPHVGAVGIENTYAVRRDGEPENLTPAPEEIQYFDV